MPRIAIVGAGIAGLNAALTLHDAGLSCSIYEASDRIGGRMHSDSTTWADGMVSEWCGEFIDGNHETIHQLIKRFGLTTIDLERARAKRAQNIMYFCNRFYGAEELARDFQALAPLLGQQLQEVGFPTTHAHFTQEGFRLDQYKKMDDGGEGMARLIRYFQSGLAQRCFWPRRRASGASRTGGESIRIVSNLARATCRNCGRLRE